MIDIAIIFTCFNRIDKTKRCMEALLNEQHNHEGQIKFSLFITDDGSTDGTKEMLQSYSNCLSMHVIDGGNLYWDKGMYRAMKVAVQKYHDYYLMINDDVAFSADFIRTMLDSYKMAKQPCGVSGPTDNMEHTVTTYGGRLFNNKSLIAPNGFIQECNLANWNCFLVNHEVIEAIGIIDPNYMHSYGDYDYSMLMQRNGFKVFIAKDYIGSCERNSLKGTFKDKDLSRMQRIRRFFSPKGMSLKSGIRYSLKNIDYLGLYGLFKFLGAYCRNLLVVFIG